MQTYPSDQAIMIEAIEPVNVDLAFSVNAGSDPEPGVPKKEPEIEPEKLPNEDPGIQPGTKPKKENGDDDDDDDDDDDYTPYTEPEIGDDPDKERVKVPIM